jgi:para-nitrobenzyl esterase
VKLADTMSSYWANFARTGDPNGKGLPEWPRFRDMNSRVMVLGDTVAVESTVPAAKLSFYTAAHQRMREP